jgi:hypothetical protein
VDFTAGFLPPFTGGLLVAFLTVFVLVFVLFGVTIAMVSMTMAGWVEVYGTFKGVVQNNDMYSWKARVKAWREESIQKEGYVNLLH